MLTIACIEEMFSSIRERLLALGNKVRITFGTQDSVLEAKMTNSYELCIKINDSICYYYNVDNPRAVCYSEELIQVIKLFIILFNNSISTLNCGMYQGRTLDLLGVGMDSSYDSLVKQYGTLPQVKFDKNDFIQLQGKYERSILTLVSNMCSNMAYKKLNKYSTSYCSIRLIRVDESDAEFELRYCGEKVCGSILDIQFITNNSVYLGALASSYFKNKYVFAHDIFLHEVIAPILELDE